MYKRQEQAYAAAKAAVDALQTQQATAETTGPAQPLEFLQAEQARLAAARTALREDVYKRQSPGCTSVRMHISMASLPPTVMSTSCSVREAGIESLEHGRTRYTSNAEMCIRDRVRPISLKDFTTRRRRILYSSRMRSISPSHSFRAVMAAYWLVVGLSLIHI